MIEIKFRVWNQNLAVPGSNEFMEYSDKIGLTKFFTLYPKNGIVMRGGAHRHIMWFAGQTDKNGKNIYIGDILSKKWLAEVYQNDEGTFMVKFHTNPTENKPISLKKYLRHRTKAGTSDEDNIIIGNIFENSELISEI